MPLDELLATAWADHGTHTQAVADRLAGSLSLVAAPEQVAPFVRIVTHVYGEHLGLWSVGIALLNALRASHADPAIERGIAVLRYAGGDGAVLATLSSEDRVFVLASAAATYAGRQEFERALSAYSDALRQVNAGLPPESIAIRALAVGGNNLAAALEEKSDRTPAQTQGMLMAAASALEYWKVAGTWLEDERAEYRLARSLLAAGDGQGATLSAQRCIDVCTRNDAPAPELFFGHVALALASRAAGDLPRFDAACVQALLWFEKVPPQVRPWCDTALRELGQSRMQPDPGR